MFLVYTRLSMNLKYSLPTLLVLSLSFIFSSIGNVQAYTYCGFGETYDYLTDSCKCFYGGF